MVRGSCAVGAKGQGTLVRRTASPRGGDFGADGVRSGEGSLVLERALQARACERRHGVS